MAAVTTAQNEIQKPGVTPDAAARLIKDVYGFAATDIKELNGYDDRNFFFRASADSAGDNFCDDGYVLKVTNSQDSRQESLFDAQHAMVRHLAERGVIVPEPVKNKHGDLKRLVRLADTAACMVRVLKFIPGKILYDVDPWTAEHFRQCGDMIGRVAVALKDFKHEAYDTRDSIWFLSSIPRVKKFTAVIENEKQRKLALDIFDAFERDVSPVQGDLESGYIHGDFNEQNIIVREDRLHGIIDFSDSQKNPVVFDLAIGIMYMMTRSSGVEHNLVGGHVLAGYRKHRAPPEREVSLLRTLVAARFAQSLTLGAHAFLQTGDEYVLVTAKEGGWQTLERFWRLPADELYAGWNNVVAEYEQKGSVGVSRA